MQRPESTFSDASSSAGTSASATPSAMRSSRISIANRQRPVPGGPRKPTSKPSLPSLSPRTQLPVQQQPQPQPQSQQRQEGPVEQHHVEEDRHQHECGEEQHEEHRLSKDQPPSYMQSQHDSQRHGNSYTPPPTSAITSDSSCSRLPMSVYTRTDTPSSVSAFSPARAMSPAPALGPLVEDSPSRQSSLSPPVASTSVVSGSEPTALPTERTTSPNIPSISKPSSPVPESPLLASMNARPRMVITFPTPAPLQPPPAVDFSSVPIAWKGLTLDAAQWTFSSAELQQIVSRAIRASAEPSSIRLLPLQVLDGDLVQEVERLESERAQATAQYRFTMHRRNMLLQSLNASSSSISPSSASANTINLSQNPALSPAADLAQRLAEVSATLDRLTAALIRVSDQLAQIRSLREVHSASALAVALRKLNASYARRVREVESLKERLLAVEDERDEAWRVAEELAMEYDEEAEDTTEANVVNGERAVAFPATLTRASRVVEKIKVPGVGPRLQQRRTEDGNREKAELSESETKREQEPDTSAVADDLPEETPGESSASNPATRRRRANSATSRVTAARTRSIRASKASLRFPRKRNESRPTSTYSQGSQHSGRARSRSRANSVSSLRDGSPTIAPGGSIPDVPKVPNATELARLASVKSTSSSVSAITAAELPPIPPPPPPPIETSSSRIGSFLDMATRPNSVVDEKGKSPVRASPIVHEDKKSTSLGSASSSRVQEGEVSTPAGDVQANGGAAVAGADARAGLERQTEIDGSTSNIDEVQVITVTSHPELHQASFSTSPAELSMNPSDVNVPDVAHTKKEMSLRPTLTVYPPSWTRPPPDSPVDVARGSGPHRADNGDDDVFDDEEDELADVLESAYSKTQFQTATRGRMYARTPLRTQHAQSMLPFPGTGSAGTGTSLSGGGNINTMSHSPASDNQITITTQGADSGAGTGPFYDSAASARRPTSLPSAQTEKRSWEYF